MTRVQLNSSSVTAVKADAAALAAGSSRIARGWDSGDRETFDQDRHGQVGVLSDVPERLHDVQ